MKILCKKILSGFAPFGDSEFEKFQKFELGDVYEVDVKLKRNPAFHRKFFALLNLTFQNQEIINDFDLFREAVTIEAGFTRDQILLDGTIQPRAKSISFGKMDQVEFEEVYNRVLDVCLLVVNQTNPNSLTKGQLEMEVLNFA